MKVRKKKEIERVRLRHLADGELFMYERGESIRMRIPNKYTIWTDDKAVSVSLSGELGWDWPDTEVLPVYGEFVEGEGE